MGLTSLRGSQENELDEEGEVRGGVGGAQLGQLPGHEEVAGGLALVHLPWTALAGLWRGRKEEKNNTPLSFVTCIHVCTVHVLTPCTICDMLKVHMCSTCTRTICSML